MPNPPSPYDILFDPVPVGPVTAPNRFYQVPHCTGLGWLRPRMVAEMRGVKAEGGWGVVCTEYCSIHESSDDLPFPYASLWNQADVRAHALMTEKVHAHGSLAGVELWAGGERSSNLFSREVPLGVADKPNLAGHPLQCRAMDRTDIRNLRGWHRDAALRARAADFDIVYVYATHGYLLSHFLHSRSNQRGDEYGGSLENRCRLVRELIEETKDAVGDRCAVAVRFSVDDGGGRDGTPVYDELREAFEYLAELPDLWDVNIGDYSYEMGASRFVREGSLEPYLSFVRSKTSKPVVSVGRFTSPDTMVSQVRRGILDFIGAARPSIADPFLPEKIRTGRLEEIRECIGCNICYASDGLSIPIRCTQNPTMGEEWRRGWHPERLPRADSRGRVLIVGAGPAGMEAARVAGERGYEVMLAEARDEPGGRVTLESRLPGLNEWARVRDYRLQRLRTMTNVGIYPGSVMGVDDVLEVGAGEVLIATGSRWRSDGFGRTNGACLDEETAWLYTPDDIMSGKLPEGRVLVYDDDNYYMAGVIAEVLAVNGREVIYATSDVRVSSWCSYTAEQMRIQKRLVSLGVEILLSRQLDGLMDGGARLTDLVRDRESIVAVDAVVAVTARLPNDGLYHELLDHVESDAGFRLSRIGDCDAPSIIADAVFSGHRWGRELGGGETPVRHDRVFERDGPESS